MAITPDEDKTAFWNRIRGDPWIEKKFGLQSATESIASRTIRKQRTVDDEELKGDIRLVLIFDIASNESIGPYEQSCIQVDVLVPADRQYWADGILTQIVALCGAENEDGWTVKGRPLAKTVSVGDLTAAAGFYRCGARFYYYSATVKRKQTL